MPAVRGVLLLSVMVLIFGTLVYSDSGVELNLTNVDFNGKVTLKVVEVRKYRVSDKITETIVFAVPYIAPTMSFVISGPNVPQEKDVLNCEPGEITKKFDEHTDNFIVLHCHPTGQ